MPQAQIQRSSIDVDVTACCKQALNVLLDGMGRDTAYVHRDDFRQFILANKQRLVITMTSDGIPDDDASFDRFIQQIINLVFPIERTAGFIAWEKSMEKTTYHQRDLSPSIIQR